MRNLVTFTQPKFKPLPGELTPERIREATLPVKIGIAQRAIAACCDLSELLTWKDKLAALAAAAKMAKMPELSRDVNRVHKEAIFRMGELLESYSSAKPSASTMTQTEKSARHKENKRRRNEGLPPLPALPKNNKGLVSQRHQAAQQAGIHAALATNSVRLIKAPAAIRNRILEDDSIKARHDAMIRYAPRAVSTANPRTYSNIAAAVFRGSNAHDRSGGGLVGASRALTSIAVDSIAQLTPEEKTRARKLIVEMQEILDAMMQRLELAP